jgi:NAD(P)H-nitrite reductase large subunit
MGISGCSNCCSDSWLKDLGFFGTDEGFTAVAGGKGGGTPRPGIEIATGLTAEQSVKLAEKVIAFYRANGKAPERLGATIDRVGFDAFVRAVL